MPSHPIPGQPTSLRCGLPLEAESDILSRVRPMAEIVTGLHERKLFSSLRVLLVMHFCDLRLFL